MAKLYQAKIPSFKFQNISIQFRNRLEIVQYKFQIFAKNRALKCRKITKAFRFLPKSVRICAFKLTDLCKNEAFKTKLNKKQFIELEN